jgi:ATP-dependent Lhr-like helicase
MHRGTLATLRRAVEPVAVAAWQRFVFAWHGLDGTAAADAEGLAQALRRLTGCAAPVAAFEQSLFPERVAGYAPGLLDQLLAAGDYAWLRPQGAGGADGAATAPIRTTAIAFVPRAELDDWAAWLGTATGAAPVLSPAAAAVHAALAAGGALFALELGRRTGLAPEALADALGELVGAGLVGNDGFAGLRALLAPVPRRTPAPPAPLPGRWSLLPPPAARNAAGIDRIARALLDRYGVVFRAALAREARYLPPWRDLVRTWRRLEARGEIRGGRFVAGFAGEQFALPEAADALRAARSGSSDGRAVVISAADPLNLAGIVTPGERVPALAGNRVLYRDGVAVAAQLGASFRWLGAAERDYEWTARTALLRGDPRLACAPEDSPAA